MPATSTYTQMQRRKSLATSLRSLTLGMGVAVGCLGLSELVLADQCDRCAAMAPSGKGPSCGCETALPSAPCKPKCVPKPSFAEKIFQRLDRVGDSIEAKMKKPGQCGCDHQQPTCGCEVNAGPSCGCEPRIDPSCGFEPQTQYVYMPASPPPSPARPVFSPNFPADPNKHAIGSIGDQHIAMPNSPAIPPKTAPLTRPSTQPNVPPKAPPTLTSLPDKKLMDEVVSEPTVSKIPFEKRSPNSAAPQRILPVDTPATHEHDHEHAQEELEQPTSPFGAIPRDVTPLPPATTLPPSPIEQSLPDVLVDPFKDDVGVVRSEDGIVLTSSRQTKSSGLLLRSKQKGKNPNAVETPAKLTPTQRQTPSISLGGGELPSNVTSAVIPSAYHEIVPMHAPVNVAPRRDVAPIKILEDEPNVSKIAVPMQRR